MNCSNTDTVIGHWRSMHQPDIMLSYHLSAHLNYTARSVLHMCNFQQRWKRSKVAHQLKKKVCCVWNRWWKFISYISFLSFCLVMLYFKALNISYSFMIIFKGFFSERTLVLIIETIEFLIGTFPIYLFQYIVSITYSNQAILQFNIHGQ